MPALLLRPMGIGDILDATFRLYRNHFVTFLLIGLVTYVPYAIVLGVVQPDMHQNRMPFPGVDEGAGGDGGSPNDYRFQVSQRGSPELDPGAAIAMVLAAIVWVLVVWPLTQAAYAIKISSAYLGEEGVGAMESYRRGLRRFVPLMWTNFLVFVAIVIGFMLCFVPGVIFAFWFWVAVPAVLFEDRSGPAAMRRSRELMKDNFGKAFLLGLVVGLLCGIINFAIGALVAVIPWPHYILENVAANLLQVLTIPVYLAAPVLLYYDLRIRKEAFDLEQLAEAVSAGA